MKHLPKHLRPTWRYLAVELESDGDMSVDRRAFQREVWYAGQNLLGDPGSAAADLRVVRFRRAGNKGEAIVRVRHGEVGRARAAIACLSSVDGLSMGVFVKKVSGTIRGAESAF